MSHEADRTWVLILGVSGLVVLFWFVEGGVALRYFVRYSIHMLSLIHSYVAWGRSCS